MNRLCNLATSFLLVLMAVVAAVPARPVAAEATATGAASRGGFSPGAGILWQSDADLARDLDAMAATKAAWLRVDFAWPTIEATQGVYSWSTTDRIVDAARARGLKVIALPAYTPAWARPVGTTDKHPPSDPASFARFVRAAVTRYSTRVDVWEIWNEPNIAPFWQPRPDPGAYTSLLRAAASAVREVDPTATVVSAGLSPAVDAPDGSQIAPVTFLEAVYAAGGRGSFDAVGMHPYSFPARPMDPTTASWNTFYRLPLVYDVMVANGDGSKKIWSTEYGAPTGTSTQAVSEAEQSIMVAEAYDAMAAWPWAGPLLWYAHRDAGNDPADREQNFGLLRRDFTEKLAYATFKTSMAPSAPTVQSLAPAGAVVQVGKHTGGTVAALALDDDAFYSVASAKVSSSQVATWYASFPSVSNALTGLQVTWRGLHTRTCAQTLSVWNWVTRSWVSVDRRSAGTTETEVGGLAPAGSPADYVSGITGDGEVRVRVSCTTRTGSFTTRGELVRLSVTV